MLTMLVMVMMMLSTSSHSGACGGSCASVRVSTSLLLLLAGVDTGIEHIEYMTAVEFRVTLASTSGISSGVGIACMLILVVTLVVACGSSKSAGVASMLILVVALVMALVVVVVMVSGSASSIRAYSRSNRSSSQFASPRLVRAGQIRVDARVGRIGHTGAVRTKFALASARGISEGVGVTNMLIMGASKGTSVSKSTSVTNMLTMLVTMLMLVSLVMVIMMSSAASNASANNRCWQGSTAGRSSSHTICCTFVAVSTGPSSSSSRGSGT